MALSQQDTGKYLENLTANIDAINKVADTVRGTVGPKGLDVMLVDQYGEYTCTNDGVEILSNIDVNHPTAKLLIEVAKAQENKVGDGTTTATILTDKILSSALESIKENNHSPVRLVKGIEQAIDFVINQLKENAQEIKDINDTKLEAITKISARGDQEISSLLIEAAKRSIENNKVSILPENFTSNVKVSLAKESQVLDGILIKKRSHFDFNSKLKDSPVLVIEGAFEPEPIPAEAVTTDEGVKKFENNIYALRELAKKIIRAGIKVILVDASMLPTIEEFFVKEGVFVLTRVQKTELKEIAEISGTKLFSREALVSMDPEEVKRNSGQLKSLVRHSDLDAFLLEGAKAYRATVLISAETSSALNERERVAIDAARAMQSAFNSGCVLGEGIAEFNLQTELASFINAKSENADIDEAVLAGMQAVERSLSALFEQILINAGFSPEAMFDKIQASPTNTQGFDFDTGFIINLEEAGILDPLEVKTSALRIASEVVSQILRISLVLQSK